MFGRVISGSHCQTTSVRLRYALLLLGLNRVLLLWLPKHMFLAVVQIHTNSIG